MVERLFSTIFMLFILAPCVHYSHPKTENPIIMQWLILNRTKNLHPFRIEKDKENYKSSQNV